MSDEERGNGESEPVAGTRHRAARTRAEAMGIPPALGTEGKGESRDLKKRLAAADEAIEKARAESRENAEKYVRLAAEMDNLRKRHRQEQAERLQYGNSELIGRLLPVVDNFHRALEHAPDAGGSEAPQEWVAGLTMVLRQLEDILAAEGVTPIDAVGQDFDPNRHQAVIAEPSDEHEEGKVIAEMQRGYMLHDRVLRPSMVKVARNSS